jgi:hypothetical protein
MKNFLKHLEFEQDGFFTMMLSILFIVIMVIVLAYLRVAHARQ